MEIDEDEKLAEVETLQNKGVDLAIAKESELAALGFLHPRQIEQLARSKLQVVSDPRYLAYPKKMGGCGFGPKTIINLREAHAHCSGHPIAWDLIKVDPFEKIDLECDPPELIEHFLGGKRATKNLFTAKTEGILTPEKVFDSLGLSSLKKLERKHAVINGTPIDFSTCAKLQKGRKKVGKKRKTRSNMMDQTRKRAKQQKYHDSEPNRSVPVRANKRTGQKTTAKTPLDKFDETQVKQHRLKRRTECEHCRALLFENESSSWCCNHGKIELDPLPVDKTLKKLALGDSPESKYYRKHINKINTGFQFATIGIKQKKQKAGGTPNIIIQGHVYHRIGSIEPNEGETPKFLQIYFNDIENEVENRKAIVLAFEEKSCDDDHRPRATC